jgi:RNA polymerase sigma-70 factor (ECF subfamily)
MNVDFVTTEMLPLAYDIPLATDEGLMGEVASGSSAALTELYDRYVRSCFGLALKIVRDPSGAEEVVQEVFLKLWTNPCLFSSERGKFKSWLLTLVHNRAVDRLRRLKRGSDHASLPLYGESDSQQTLVDVVLDDGPGPYEQVWSSEKSQIVRGKLDELSEPHRQMLVMAYFEGLTQREIAERLRQPIGTVKTRTRAALTQMRNMLAGKGLIGELE